MIAKIKKYGKLILIIVLFLLFLNGIDMVKTDTSIDNIISPDGTYSINIYKCVNVISNESNLKVELVENKTGNKKDIYLSHDKDNVDIDWLDNDNIEINGIKINIHENY